MRSVSEKGHNVSAPTDKANCPASVGGETQSTSPNHMKYSGIHNRRDKRYPFRSGRVRPEDIAEVQAYEAAQHGDDAPEVPKVEAWKEALMLWLSWNSTYEKVTARMCKSGQNQQKLEAMMDEMDQLRKRAIAMSERVIA